MAEIDRVLFAADVAGALDHAKLSYKAACAAHPEIDKAMLSRACNGKPLSAANHLAVCQALKLDPYSYLLSSHRQRTTLRGILKRLENQPVTVGVKRETAEVQQ